MSRHAPDNTRLPSIGQAELEILSYIQAHHPVSVRDVADHLAAARGIVRTTVLNVMSRLVAKGFIARRRVKGIYQYFPRIARGTLLRDLVREFVDNALGGSISPFVAFLTDNAKVSQAELAQLKKLVSELDDRAGKEKS